MYIRRKVFSLLNIEGEERYFSTTEIQKDFARVDYEGLTAEGKAALKKRRSEYAKNLLKNHRSTQAGIDSVGGNHNKLETVAWNNGGGVRSKAEVETIRGIGQSDKEFLKQHKDGVNAQMQKGSRDAAKIMRKETEAKYGTVVEDPRLKKEYTGKTSKSATAEGVKEKIKKDPVNLATVEKKVVNKGKKLGKAGKIAAIAGGTALAAGAGAYAYKKHKDKKEKN